MKQVSKKRKGFTLVELIVVIAILLILAVSAVVAYNGFNLQAKRASLKSDASALVTALNNLNSYAISPITPDKKITGLGEGGFKAVTNNASGGGASDKGVYARWEYDTDDSIVLYLVLYGANSSTGADVEVAIQMSKTNALLCQRIGDGTVANASTTDSLIVYRQTKGNSLVTEITFWSLNETCLTNLKDSDFNTAAATVIKAS